MTKQQASDEGIPSPANDVSKQDLIESSICALAAAAEAVPSDFAATGVLIHAYQRRADAVRAEEICLDFIRRNPSNVEALRCLAQLQRTAGKIEAAIESFRQVVKCDERSTDALVDLGIALAHGKRFPEAKDAFASALAVQSDHFDALMNTGIVLQEMGQRPEALDYLKKAADIRPDDISVQNNLGVALAEQGKFGEAVAYYRRLLERAPNYVLAWNNLGNALRSLGQLEEALVALNRALQLKPDYAEAHNNIGIVLAQRESFEEAIRAYDTALMLRPDYPEAHANRGLVHLLQGNFQHGWSDYEWRWQGPRGLKRRIFQGKLWDGSPLPGKRILLYCEQGLGDTFQFVRYARELKARGATVILECQGNTKEILAKVPGVDEWIVRGETPPKADFYAPLLSLPGLCQTTLESIPRRVPYLFSDPASMWEWKQRLAAHPDFRIGIVWQGNPEHKGDKARSIPLASFAPLAAIPRVTLVSLQRNFGTEQLAALDGKFQVTDLAGTHEGHDGWLRTAAIISNLDLVIGADTSVLHLAGAMGSPAWLALPTSPDWRWLLGREDTPWYPTMRLFRQNRPGDWDEVFQRMATAIRELLAASVEARTRGDSIATGVATAEALVRSATHHLASGELREAEQLLWKAIALDPTLASAHQDLGVACARQGRLTQALSCFRRALEMSPDSAALHANIGMAHYQLGDPENAVIELRKAVWLGAGSAETYKSLAKALMMLPSPMAAEECFWAVLRLAPDDAEAHYLLSTALLMQEKYQQGWLEHEWKSIFQKKSERRHALGRWTGESLSEKRILVVANDDPREVIQFARYIDLLAERGAKVCVECAESMTQLVSGCRGVAAVVTRSHTPPTCDLFVPIQSIPATLGEEGRTVSARRPYLGAATQLSERWANQYPHADKAVRIVLALDPVEGSRAGYAAFRAQLEHRLRTDFAGTPIEWFRLAAPDPSSPVMHLEPLTMDAEGVFADKAELQAGEIPAFLSRVDLVIATDNIVAHIAGAIGRSVWTVLPIAAHHRWLVGRDDTPWYPTMRLFRQRLRNVWEDVGDRIVQAISRQLSAKGEGAERKS